MDGPQVHMGTADFHAFSGPQQLARFAAPAGSSQPMAHAFMLDHSPLQGNSPVSTYHDYDFLLCGRGCQPLLLAACPPANFCGLHSVAGTPLHIAGLHCALSRIQALAAK